MILALDFLINANIIAISVDIVVVVVGIEDATVASERCGGGGAGG